MARVSARQLKSGTTTLTSGTPLRPLAAGAGILVAGKQAPQVLGVAGLSQLRDVRPQLGVINPSLPPGDLLKAGDLQALPVFDHLDEFRRFQKRLVGSGVEPRRPSAEQLGMEDSVLQVFPVEVGDL